MTIAETNKILEEVTKEIKEEMKDVFSKMNPPKEIGSLRLETEDSYNETIKAYMNLKQTGGTPDKLIKTIEAKLTKNLGGVYSYNIGFVSEGETAVNFDEGYISFKRGAN